jgi:hypothetical protein
MVASDVSLTPAEEMEYVIDSVNRYYPRGTFGGIRTVRDGFDYMREGHRAWSPQYFALWRRIHDDIADRVDTADALHMSDRARGMLAGYAAGCIEESGISGGRKIVEKGIHVLSALDMAAYGPVVEVLRKSMNRLRANQTAHASQRLNKEFAAYFQGRLSPFLSRDTFESEAETAP